MKNVLVLMPVEARHKEKIEAAGKDCRIVYSTPAQVTEEQIRSANVMHYVNDAGVDILIAANRETDEVAMYEITE